jgi:hypothetical protein
MQEEETQQPKKRRGKKIHPVEYETELCLLAQEHKIEIQIQRFPIEDRKAPEPTQLQEICDYLQKECVENKHKTLVHCKGGGGRASFVALAFAIHQKWHEGLSSLEWIVLQRTALALRSTACVFGMTKPQLQALHRMLSHVPKPPKLAIVSNSDDPADTYDHRKCLYFWSHYRSQPNAREINTSVFSQFFKATIRDAQGKEYNCNEQYYQAEKALAFGDQQVHDKIMSLKTPKSQKQHGQYVRGFDKRLWAKPLPGAPKGDNRTWQHKHMQWRVLVCGNWFKAQQCPAFAEALKQLDDWFVVEASPRDWVCGIGLSAAEAERVPRRFWPGANQLGLAIRHVADHLQKGTMPPELAVAKGLETAAGALTHRQAKHKHASDTESNKLCMKKAKTSRVA